MSKLGQKFTKKSINWDVDTQDAKYLKASELEEGRVYPLHGCFLTSDNGYGVGAVLISEDEDVILVNAPSRTVEAVKEIINTEDLIQSIKDGNEFFKVRSYMNTKLKKAKKCFAIDFCDESGN